MGRLGMKFSLENFKQAIQNGFLQPYCLSYDYVDKSKYEKLQQDIEWKNRRIEETFEELKNRMGRKYYKNVFLAQSNALNYAALQFPAYSFLFSEDLLDDWLAIVDFHKKYSRDHSLHQPMTAYVAAQLLGYGDPSTAFPISTSSGNLLDFCVEAILTKPETHYILESASRYGLPNNILRDSQIARAFWKGLFYRTVVLSALFHDIGYPWQYMERVGKELRKNVSNLYQSGNVVTQLIEDFSDRMMFLPLRNYETTHRNEPVFEKDRLVELTMSALDTHGFPGAIAFLSLNDAIRKSVVTEPMAKIHEFMVEWAAMGIFMHDMEGKHRKQFPRLKLSFIQDPLSSVVAMADYLEEFDRPKVTFTSRSKESRARYGFDCSLVNVNLEGSVLNVEMSYVNNSSKAIAAEFKREETEHYFNPSNGYVDLKPLGINKVVYSQV